MEQNFPEISFIKGWVRTSLIDYPGKIAMVIYTAGCNLRCPFCHNPELLQFPERYDSINLQEIISFLKLRAGVIDGIVISGGEPLIHAQIIDLLRIFRSMNIHIKMDTNGCFPARLQEIIESELVDMVAMDIKASKKHYAAAVGKQNGIVEKVDESLCILKTSGIPFELRTTVIPNLHTTQEIEEIAKWISPIKQYYLQQFRPAVTYAPEYQTFKPLSEQELAEMKQIALAYIQEVHIRGLA